MTNEIQKQYDRLDDVPSIMLRMKEVYTVPDRHIRYAATKSFFGIKMAEGVRIGDLKANGIGLHHHNKAHGPTGITVQQLDRALDGGHEINCLGLGLKCSKSRTSRMGIESPVETCTKSRIHWMSAAFHRRQMWVVYAILVGWID
ncbi:UNVERIFIED_CONTAM: hypothetical protein Slati_1416600 [Sesamum latifolium]|uniref:Uncharacterized protein n=1 Tax=Sesamum latifolium TaxID=2727402 RepID=A0AAW2X315_9LAMI